MDLINPPAVGSARRSLPLTAR